MVGVGREELADQVAMSGMNLNGIHPCFTSQVHGLPIGSGHRWKLRGVQPTHEGWGVEIESAGCTNRGTPADAFVRHVSTVPQLDGSSGSLFVDRIGQLTQPRDNLLAHP